MPLRSAGDGLQLGRVREEIPADALPYLGRGLDPSLFSVAALQRAESGGRLPVQLAFTGRRPALPGVTITRSGPRSADGYLTAASAIRFGAALARQVRADHARASYGADGLFGGGVQIALAGTARQAPARPAFRMHTLTVTGSNLSGQADNGDEVFGGNFRIAFTAPGGVDVTLPVSATDAAGGSITETILRAYRVTI